MTIIHLNILVSNTHQGIETMNRESWNSSSRVYTQQPRSYFTIEKQMARVFF